MFVFDTGIVFLRTELVIVPHKQLESLCVEFFNMRFNLQ